MGSTRNESKLPGTSSRRRPSRLGMAAFGLTLTVGGSGFLVPTAGAAHLDSNKAKVSTTAILKAQEAQLATIASTRHIGTGALMAAEKSLAETVLNDSPPPASNHVVVTGADQPVATTRSSAYVSVDAAIVAFGRKHGLGLGAVLAEQRDFQIGLVMAPPMPLIR